MTTDAGISPERPDPPSSEVLEELLTYEVAWIGDSLGSNLMDPEIRCVYQGVGRFAGPAVTVTVPPGDFLMIPAALNQTREGDVLVIPPNVVHSAVAIEDTVAIDAFSPLRMDWLRGDDSYLRTGKSTLKGR